MKKPDVPFYIDPIHSAASLLGRKGGQARSDKKTLSSRENGKKGGRPRQIDTETLSIFTEEEID